MRYTIVVMCVCVSVLSDKYHRSLEGPPVRHQLRVVHSPPAFLCLTHSSNHDLPERNKVSRSLWGRSSSSSSVVGSKLGYCFFFVVVVGSTLERSLTSGGRGKLYFLSVTRYKLIYRDFVFCSQNLQNYKLTVTVTVEI